MNRTTTGQGLATPFSRRALIAGGLGAAATGLLASCSTVTRSTDVQAINKAVRLPDYVPWTGGPEPVLPKTSALMPSAFRKIPDRLVPTRGKPGDGSAVHGSVPTSSPIPPAKANNPYWQGLDERMGVELGLTITPSADFDSKFATQVAGNALGDVFTISGAFSYLPQFLEAKAADLTPYLSGSAVRDYPYLANIPTASWKGTVYSGAIYALPVPRGPLASSVLYQRNDLFERLGVDPSFSSVDEFLQLCRQVTDADANRWALAGAPPNVIASMLGLPNQWQESAGRFTSMYEVDGYQDMLELQRKLIAEDLVHPDSISAFNGKVWFVQGSAVMLQDTYSAVPGLLQQATPGTGFDVRIAPFVGPAGKTAKPWLGNPINTITAIAAGSEERVRMLLRIMDWCASPFGTEAWMYRKFGIEGRDFEYRDGAPVLTKTGNSETALGEFPVQYFTEGPLPLYYVGNPGMTDKVYESLASWLDDGVADPTYGLYSSTKSVKGAALTAWTTDAVNNVLLGRTRVSDWPSVVKQWRQRGGDAQRHEYEEALAARSS
ncbi:putative aldouronate transport system substrate-binding protein [Curtobacterium sp. UNCCL20]|uniref:extracellular solute-binding protein n=1 Tax=Curtobacterium sp. UNCCL20 TaxID=1502773 RepID=UPI00088023CD|nr:extracellular solute-binding protein [Curtobacterium sp. UNCCL20]SDR07671.1 putative aldouronate transport system substrate-binding protein [Curtobacterium sp. UNCCL20]